MDWKTFWQIAPTIIAVFTIVVGYIFTSGRLKERISHMVSNEALLIHCRTTQKECSQGVGVKIDELKTLVIQLHDAQTTKIDKMDEKRENAREKLDKDKESNNSEMVNIKMSIASIEGHLKSMVKNG